MCNNTGLLGYRKDKVTYEALTETNQGREDTALELQLRFSLGEREPGTKAIRNAKLVKVLISGIYAVCKNVCYSIMSTKEPKVSFES